MLSSLKIQLTENDFVNNPNMNYEFLDNCLLAFFLFVYSSRHYLDNQVLYFAWKRLTIYYVLISQSVVLIK